METSADFEGDMKDIEDDEEEEKDNKDEEEERYINRKSEEEGGKPTRGRERGMREAMRDEETNHKYSDDDLDKEMGEIDQKKENVVDEKIWGDDEEEQPNEQEKMEVSEHSLSLPLSLS